MHLPPLTKSQRRLMDAIITHIEQHRVTPTYHDLMAQLGYTSTNSVTGVLRELRYKGYLTPGTGKYRRRIQLSDAYRLVVLPLRQEEPVRKHPHSDVFSWLHIIYYALSVFLAFCLSGFLLQTETVNTHSASYLLTEPPV